MWFGIKTGSAFLLLILGWIAGKKASGLLYAGSLERLQRKLRKQLSWAGIVTIAAAGVITGVVGLMNNFEFAIWKLAALVQAPFVVVPLAAVLLVSVPKLIRLRHLVRGTSGPIEDRHVRHGITAPELIVPFQALAFGGTAVVYFTFVVPANWLEIAIPAAIYIAICAALWLAHSRRRRLVTEPEAGIANRRAIRALRDIRLLAAAVGVAAVLIIAGQRGSVLPGKLDMMAGPMDFGGGASLAHDHAAGHATAAGSVSLAKLTGPATGTPDRKFTLTAQQGQVTFSSGKQVDVWTYNGETPGPELRMKEGELVEVTLENKDIDMGVTLHWHGLDVPNAEDGVAGVTQDAVMPGERHVYRFRAEQVGTFWYHSHQDSKEAVRRGLFGPLIVEPRDSIGAAKDITVMTHLWNGAGFAIGDNVGVQKQKIAPGTKVRLRLINTDDWVIQKYTLTGAPFQVAAIDGADLHEPGTLENQYVELPTGGRADLTFEMPNHTVYLAVGNGLNLGILMSPHESGEVPVQPSTTKFDPVHYGTPAATPFNASSEFDRSFEVILDNKLGFWDGGFTQLYTINGHVFPDTPMFMVQEGDLVKVKIVNRGMVDHPMHLHGHHVLVLSHNGEPVTGSPWWSDTLGVNPGETYEVAFLANNPGIWMDHCHNLTHAKVGMTMHLGYIGVTTPYAVGSETHNHPE